MGKTLREMTDEIREVNVALGWRPAEGGPGENTWGDYIALLYSEVSEALEAYRDHRLKDATEVDDCEGLACDIHGHEPNKPEGVGSEFADVLIRLLDMCDVFGIQVFDMDMGLEDVAAVQGPESYELRTFGDHLAWLNQRAGGMWLHPRTAPVVLRVLVTVARKYEIDLDAEYARKIAFNRTRPFQHGGRTVADSGAA